MIIDHFGIVLFSIRNELIVFYTFYHSIRRASMSVVPRTHSKTRKLCRVDHCAACQVHEHESFVTCKMTLLVRKFRSNDGHGVITDHGI